MQPQSSAAEAPSSLAHQESDASNARVEAARALILLSGTSEYEIESDSLHEEDEEEESADVMNDAKELYEHTANQGLVLEAENTSAADSDVEMAETDAEEPQRDATVAAAAAAELGIESETDLEDESTFLHYVTGEFVYPHDLVVLLRTDAERMTVMLQSKNSQISMY